MYNPYMILFGCEIRITYFEFCFISKTQIMLVTLTSADFVLNLTGTFYGQGKIKSLLLQ